MTDDDEQLSTGYEAEEEVVGLCGEASPVKSVDKVYVL